MKFIDSIEILIKAGRGGDGIVSFKKSKGKPKLGPDGGDGGTGGSIVFSGTGRLNTLSALRYRAIYKAEDGVRGGPNCRRGACGEDLVLPLPLGTVVINALTGEKLGELLHEGELLVVAKGGRHGLGNTHWVKSTHQAPEEYRPGASGDELEVRLELKLLADVGLAGFPNAGKSTLLSRVSAARPKIADYPFTTLVPNLGVVEVDGDDFELRAFVMADVPGLIEGASAGRGLGLQFLKHLERTSIIAYVLDAMGPFFGHAATSVDADLSADSESLSSDPTAAAGEHAGVLELTPTAALAVLQRELATFSPELASKRAVIVLNKIDLLDDEALAKVQATLLPQGLEVICISAATGRGLLDLKRRLYEIMVEEKATKLLATQTAATHLQGVAEALAPGHLAAAVDEHVALHS